MPTIPSSSKDIVAAAWTAFASRDVTRIADAFTPDARWIAPAGNATAVALGYTHAMEGRDAIVQFITVEFRKLFVDAVQVDILSLFDDGDTAVMEQRIRGRLANGRDYDNLYCFVIETLDGRIGRAREYMDTLGGQRMVFGDEGPRMIA